jgi:hypothetical protein
LSKDINSIIKERYDDGEITPETLQKAEIKFKKVEENRKHGIDNEYEKELLKKAILNTMPDIDLLQFTDPSHPDSRFFDLENYNQFKKNLRDVVRKDKHVFDDENTYQRLHDSIVLPFWKQKLKYDEAKKQKQDYLVDIEKRFKEEQDANLKAIQERIQKDLETKDKQQPDNKKWYEFWKKSCVEYGFSYTEDIF